VGSSPVPCNPPHQFVTIFSLKTYPWKPLLIQEINNELDGRRYLYH
jgi:hypothetical protein